MKKLLAGLLLILSIFLAAPVFAMQPSLMVPGSYYAAKNLNIRSEPQVGANLIGHFNAGDQVTVLKVMGNWCQVKYKTYRSAYSYCPFLTTEMSATGINAMGPATKTLTNIQTWLLKDNFGVNYINNSAMLAREKSLAWDQSAQLAEFVFEWPLHQNYKCWMAFSSPNKQREIFKSSCFEAAQLVMTWKENVEQAPGRFGSPKLLLKNFIANMLNDGKLVDTLDNAFSGSSLIVTIRLAQDGGGVQTWYATFTDFVRGSGMRVEVSADRTDGIMTVSKL